MQIPKYVDIHTLNINNTLPEITKVICTTVDDKNSLVRKAECGVTYKIYKNTFIIIIIMFTLFISLASDKYIQIFE